MTTLTELLQVGVRFVKCVYTLFLLPPPIFLLCEYSSEFKLFFGDVGVVLAHECYEVSIHATHY